MSSRLGSAPPSAVVLANGPLVHALADGPVTLTLRPGGPALTLTLKRGETRVLWQQGSFHELLAAH